MPPGKLSVLGAPGPFLSFQFGLMLLASTGPIRGWIFRCL